MTIPSEPKNPMMIDTDRLRSLAERVSQKFSPFGDDEERASQEVLNTAYAFNVGLALNSCASEIDRLREVEKQADELRRIANRATDQAVTIGHALAVLVLRTEKRRDREDQLRNGPIAEAFRDLIGHLTGHKQEEPAPQPQPEAQPTA